MPLFAKRCANCNRGFKYVKNERPVTQQGAFYLPASDCSMKNKTIVIGAGIGGIASALRMLALGHAVDLHEALPDPGGRARHFKRDGFSFDAGPTVITAPWLFDELFELFGEQRKNHVEFMPVDPWYRMVFDDGRYFDYAGPQERIEQEIAKFEPKDVQGYREFLKITQALFQTGFIQLGDVPFHQLRTLLKAVPTMAMLRADRSVYGLVSKFISNDYLRRAFSMHPLLVGGHPFRTTSIYALIHHLEREYGVWFARGGTAALVKAMCELFERHGGQIHFNSRIKSIQYENKTVTGIELHDGQSIQADTIISNIDPIRLYGNLLKTLPRKRWTDHKMQSLQHSMGLFVLYFASNITYPDIAHHTILFSRDYADVLDKIFDGHDVPEQLNLYLHRPSATDPTASPAGHDTFYVLFPVPNLGKAKLDWQSIGDSVAQRILQNLEAKLLPKLREHLVMQFHITPEYFSEQLDSHLGAGFSIQPLFMQSAYFRFHNQSEELENLYLCGAGAHPGAGLPGVLSSAKVVERLIKQKTAAL
jgi:phytoene desaturase